MRGTTEAINLVAKSWGASNIGAGDEIVVSHLEHHANIVPWQQLATEKGAKIRVIPVDDSGQVLLEEYQQPAQRHAPSSSPSRRCRTRSARSCRCSEIVELAHAVPAPARWSTARRRCRTCASTCRPSTPTSSSSPATRSSGPPASAWSTASATVLEQMPPWQGGGNMIQDVTFERTVYQHPPTRFEAGTGNIADAVGPGRGARLRRAHRHREHRPLRARAAGVRDAQVWRRSRACA